MKKLILFISLILTLPSWAQQVSPPPQTATSAVRPTISADFNARVRDARVWVDGNEYSQYARVYGDTVTLIPPHNLGYGTHNVQVVTQNGRQANWSFQVEDPRTAYRYRNNSPYTTDPYYQNNYPVDPYYDDDTAGVEDILVPILDRVLNRY